MYLIKHKNTFKNHLQMFQCDFKSFIKRNVKNVMLNYSLAGRHSTTLYLETGYQF